MAMGENALGDFNDDPNTTIAKGKEFSTLSSTYSLGKLLMEKMKIDAFKYMLQNDLCSQ
jgi:hypothetical protein